MPTVVMGWMDGWMGRPKDVALLLLDSGFWKGRGRRDVFVGVGSWAEAGGRFLACCVLAWVEQCCLPGYGEYLSMSGVMTWG